MFDRGTTRPRMPLFVLVATIAAGACAVGGPAAGAGSAGNAAAAPDTESRIGPPPAGTMNAQPPPHTESRSAPPAAGTVNAQPPPHTESRNALPAGTVNAPAAPDTESRVAPPSAGTVNVNAQPPSDADAVPDDGTFVEFVDGAVWRRVDRGETTRSSDSPSAGAAASRIEFLDGSPLHDPVFWYGGRFQFMDICPEWGCLAVQFGTDGAVAHAWPLRPHALEQAAHAAAADQPHAASGVPPPGFSFVRDAAPTGIARYPNGDLLVVFRNENRGSPPHVVGTVRIDRRGYPVWFRPDVSHHWPHLDGDGSALVLTRAFGDAPLSVPLDDGGSTFTLGCPRPWFNSVDVIDGDGRLVDRIDLTAAMLDSPFFAPLLIEHAGRLNRCNPFHPNFVHRIVEDVRDVRGVSSGDLVVSMRNLSAFAILDAGSGRVKRLVRGSFRHQHAVHHWRGSRFLLFDNEGGDGAHGPSRLLMVDAADGRDTTVFPNAGTPEALRGLASDVRGKISLSPDRRRALVVFDEAGVAVEVRLSDGAALKVFRSLHDVSGLEQFPEERAARPAVFQIAGLDHVHAP